MGMGPARNMSHMEKNIDIHFIHVIVKGGDLPLTKCMKFLIFVVFCHGLMMAVYFETGSLITFECVGCDCTIDKSKIYFGN